jgi:hypothetical protein
MQSETFKKAYIEESIKFDLEMKLQFIKEDIINHKSESAILKKLTNLEKFVKSEFHLTYQ